MGVHKHNFMYRPIGIAMNAKAKYSQVAIDTIDTQVYARDNALSKAMKRRSQNTLHQTVEVSQLSIW